MGGQRAGCGKRLAPFLPELVGLLERQGEVALPPPVRAQVVGLSAVTADRLLRAPGARRGPRDAGRGPPARPRPRCGRRRRCARLPSGPRWRPGSARPTGCCHGGETTQGFHLTTLVTVDVASGWTGLERLLNQKIDYGGGENPFKGTRWPLQPR